MTTPTTDLETALLDAHYAGDPAARFAWLGWCEAAIDDASRRAVRWARGQGQREEVRG